MSIPLKALITCFLFIIAIPFLGMATENSKTYFGRKQFQDVLKFLFISDFFVIFGIFLYMLWSI